MLEPLLNHPDDGGDDLTPADCAVVLPRLQAIADGWAQESDDDPLRHQDTEDARRLAGFLRVCINRRVPLLFL
ncbi:hypothetical protein [Streptomyces anandii]|uniref:hypothetical protein n=1 Tax=Streptomyces anandii TaxID=285454 RepID=UPI0027E50192|nr:hypothetical protein [Streptomyces anandii]